MKKTGWILILVPAVIFLFIGVEPTEAEESSYRALHGLNNPSYHRLNYQPLDQVYHVYVRLPQDYQQGEKYPTIYLLDGGVTFPMLAGYYRYLRLGEEVPPAIVVGISYGTEDWRQGNARSRDFTAKAADRDHWGGAGDFAAFLRGTLFPLVESQYSSDPKRRIVFGQSLGGQFVLYVAQKAPGLFWGHIASNPALHRNLPFFLSTASREESKDNLETSRLFVSSGAEDDPRFREPAMQWMAHWKKTRKPNLEP